MRRISFIIVATLSLAFSACQWRPLEDPSAAVELEVAVELKAILNVNVSVYNELITPQKIETDMIRVLFYDPGTHKLISQAFLSEKSWHTDSEGNKIPVLGGNVNVGVGKFDMLCYNFDTPDTFIRGENDITTIEAYTNEVPASIKAKYKDLEDISVLYEPDHVIVARDIGLEITPHTGLLVIETEATTIVDTYYIQIRVEGAQYASDASAILTGMSPSNRFGLAQREEDNPSAVYFVLQKSKDLKIKGGNQDVICNTFNTFGRIYHDKAKSGAKADDSNADKESALKVTFNVIRTDGKAYDFIVTKEEMEEIFDSEDARERHWLIINKTIVIEKPDTPPGGGGGFNPEVEDWQDEEGEVVI